MRHRGAEAVAEDHARPSQVAGEQSEVEAGQPVQTVIARVERGGWLDRDDRPVVGQVAGQPGEGTRRSSAERHADQPEGLALPQHHTLRTRSHARRPVSCRRMSQWAVLPVDVVGRAGTTRIVRGRL